MPKQMSRSITQFIDELTIICSYIVLIMVTDELQGVQEKF